MKKVSDTIIVSPSGSYYGSEQVLHDFLKNTINQYIIFVPQNSKFEHLLRTDEKHDIRGFKNEKNLYVLVFYLLVFKGFKGVYVNEGGHINYVKLLSKLLTKKAFFIHIRILEDTNKNRLGTLTRNIHLITISKYLSKYLNQYNHHVIYDPYSFNLSKKVRQKKEVFKIGIIGRVSKTKRIDLALSFFQYVNDNDKSRDISFHFYGDILDNVHSYVESIKKLNLSVSFEGFVEKSKMYNSVDLILHFNDEEPLGRIFFEALSENLPFIGFNTGGIGELANIVGFEMININDKDWANKMYSSILSVKEEYLHYQRKIMDIKHLADLTFNNQKYVEFIESKILEI